MTALGLALFWGSVLFGLYTYVGYPLLLKLLTALRGERRFPTEPPAEWPRVSITVPAYNEEHQIAETVESLLALDYPRDRIQILIVSDASSDRTDDIVRGYADRGVELLRMPKRGGKTAAENAASARLTGEIVINTDASIRIDPHSLKRIVAPFQDPAIGLTSSRDVSVGVRADETNQAEGGYVGYEMWVRDLETSLEGIVGASGSFYAIRRELHGLPLPDSLSRDFAAALLTREHGFRPISVSSATAVVPRTGSLAREYPRKVRTITRGMETLHHKRALLNPLRYGLFSWMLFSHKICRWLLPWVAVLGLVGLALLAPGAPWAALLLALGVLTIGVGAGAWLSAGTRRLPGLLSAPAFAVMGNVAAMKATLLALQGDRNAIWEPTRRTAGTSTSG